MKKPVSRRALVERIRRSLKKQNMSFRTNRGGPYMERYGAYYIVDLTTNSIVGGCSDLEHYGREEGVLKDWEELAE